MQRQSLFSQFEKSNINQKDSIAKQLTQYDEVGIRLLVRGLSSKDVATVLASHQALKQQLSEWQSLPNDQASSRYLIFSKELTECSKNGSPDARQLAHELAVLVQKDTINRGFEGQLLVSQNCQKVIETWQSGQRDQIAATKFDHPADSNTMPASIGEPHNTRVSGINVPYLVAQTTNTDANGRLQQLAEQQDNLSPELSATEKSATRSPENSPRVGFYSLHAPIPAPQRNDQILIARNQQKVSPFLTEYLQQLTLRDLPKLPTQDLMRLLNHTKYDISQESEAILKKRDGFQEEHILLARKLYHPEVSSRKSLLPQLVENDQLETYSWLSELLKDPEQEVRLATAKAIYSQIPLDDDELGRLKSMMQSDADHRIAALGQGLATRISVGGNGANTRNLR